MSRVCALKAREGERSRRCDCGESYGIGDYNHALDSCDWETVSLLRTVEGLGFRHAGVLSAMRSIGFAAQRRQPPDEARSTFSNYILYHPILASGGFHGSCGMVSRGHVYNVFTRVHVMPSVCTGHSGCSVAYEIVHVYS